VRHALGVDVAVDVSGARNRLLQVRLGRFDLLGTQGEITKLMGKGEAAARRELMELRGDDVEVDV